MGKWSEEIKQKALALAEATSIGAAAKETGIPKTTIWRWIQKRNGNKQTERNETPKKIKQIAEEATQEAKEEVRRYIADKAKRVADNILSMVSSAVTEAELVIKLGPKNDEPNAGWLRALIGAIAQGVEKYQLLTGKPTSHQQQSGQVVSRHEYDITQRIISDPETAELADKLLRRAADSNAGMVRTHGKPWDVVSIRPPDASEQEAP